jgi:AraC-like DNA-binding protein
MQFLLSKPRYLACLIFKHYTPSKLLQPYIQGYLEADGLASKEIGSYQLFPNGFSGIFFNFGNRGKLIVQKEYETPSVSVFGQIDQHFTALHWPGFYSLGVMLKPTVLSKLLRTDMGEFVNKAFDGALLRKDFTQLYHELGCASGIKQRIEILDGYFTQALRDIPKVVTIADYAMNIIHRQSTVSIEKIASQLRVSQRYLETNFKRSVGLSPKTYSMILRFKRIEEQLRKSHRTSIRWMDFGDEYYDQNHFIKDFKRFTGHTPTNYLIKDFDIGHSYLINH